MSSVLFVCLGNICRSPAGQGVMLSVIEQAGVSDKIQVDSAGTGAWHVGNLPDSRMRGAAEARGIILDSRARQAKASDFQNFDLIVAMDQSNYDNLKKLQGPKKSNAHLCLLGEFLDPQNPPDVPDPYYGDGSGFDQVLDMIEQACPKILQTLLEK